MTTEQLAALKKIADRAIPPFWNAQSEELFVRQFKEAFHPAACKELLEEVERLRQALKDSKDDSDAAAIESRWQSSQGEDYGSY